MNSRARLIILLMYCVLSASCFRIIRPKKDFECYTLPKVPDYSNPDCWTALPDRKDWADSVPLNSSMKDCQKTAVVDVFFVYPTSYFGKQNWNADVYDTSLNSKTDKTSIVYEATVYNESCKVYAPRYRQATLYSFIDTVNGNKALDFAYRDVKAAFQYYLDHYNNGRPIIIASHSQGTRHAIRLVKEFIDNDPALRKHLVAAYLIGGSAEINAFKNIPFSDSANQTGCYIAWESLKWGVSPRKRDYSKCACTNPLTWKNNSEYAAKEKNHGSIPVTFNRVDVGFADAECVDGKLWIHKLKIKGYPLLFGTSYHLVDYGLFYVNIRENVALRVSQYLKNNP
jgi:hypothetical protein